MKILGICYAHGDSSAALVIDGKLIAAAEEERFTRIKHCASFPFLAIQYCLDSADLSPHEIEVVALARRPWNAIERKAVEFIKRPKKWLQNRLQKKVLFSSRQRASLREMLKEAGLHQARLFRAEHHLAHLASVRFLTPKKNFALLSFDGLGDFVSTVFGKAVPQGCEIFQRIYYPHSLGFFYTAMTQYLGFPYFGDEFKVMGLSSFGKPRFLEPLRKVITDLPHGGFHLNLDAFPIPENKRDFYIENEQPYVTTLYNGTYLSQLLELPPRKPTDSLTSDYVDLAQSVQARFEEIANSLLYQLAKRVQSDTLGLAGGCAHNSVWVGKIPRVSPFKQVLVAPAAHDAGISVGAAFLAEKDHKKQVRGHFALLGPQPKEATLPPFSFGFKVAPNSFTKQSELIHWMVERLCQGQILGLFQGRMEFGPRALGQRSILCDPRFSDMKDRLNARVKHRENFRPFAASVLWDHQQDWFKNTFFAPTMEVVFGVRKEVRSQIPAVVHVDNTCRIQSVRKDWQPFYWELIDTFRKKTGIPMLLNTSFNDCEPIVCTVEDALRCFSHCEMDHLVINHHTISRIQPQADLQIPFGKELNPSPLSDT